MENDMDLIINDNGKIVSIPKQLTTEEEKQLFLMYSQTHDSLVKEKIVLHNLWIVDSLSEKYSKFLKVSKDELKSYGYLKLIELVDKYDLNSNAKFSTYAYPCIKNLYNLYIRRGADVPCNIMDILVPVIIMVEKEYCERIENNPVELIEEVINYLKITHKYNDKQIKNFKNALYHLYPISYDKLDENDNRVMDIKYNMHFEDFIINSYVKKYNKKIILEALNELEDLYYENGKKYKQILILKYGLCGNEIKTHKEIAKIYGCTEQNICAMEKTAKAKLKMLLIQKHNFIYD